MKGVHVILYSLLLTFFTAGIIFSTMASYTENSPLSLTTIGVFMVVLFVAYIIILLMYRKRRAEDKENRA